MMATNAINDLRAFRDFVSLQIEREVRTPTPEECLSLWQEWRETNGAIEEGLAELDAGLGEPLEELLTEFRNSNGIPPRMEE